VAGKRSEGKTTTMTGADWQGILRTMDEAFADYLKGMVALRKHVVDDMRRKLSDRQVLPRPSSPPERPASGARHRRARGRRPRG